MFDRAKPNHARAEEAVLRGRIPDDFQVVLDVPPSCHAFHRSYWREWCWGLQHCKLPLEKLFRLHHAFLHASSEEVAKKLVHSVLALIETSGRTQKKPNDNGEDDFPRFVRVLGKGTFDFTILDSEFNLSPCGLAQLLSREIIGQAEAVEGVAHEIYWQQQAYKTANRGDKTHGLRRGPILLTGPTGCGKTFLSSEAARAAGLPFVQIDASTLVPEGIIGTSIGEIGKKLLASVGDDAEKARFGIVFIDEIDKLLRKDVGLAYELLRMVEGHPIDLSIAPRENRRSRHSEVETKDLLFILAGAWQLKQDERFEAAAGSALGFRDTVSSRAIKQEAEARRDQGIDDDDLIESGMPLELLARIPFRYNLRALTSEDYRSLLEHPQNSPVARYNKRLRSTADAELCFEQASLHAMSEWAEHRRMGARGLSSLVARIFRKHEFELLRRSSSYRTRSHRVVSVRPAEVDALLNSNQLDQSP